MTVKYPKNQYPLSAILAALKQYSKFEKEELVSLPAKL